jgi:hypothetical protein
MRPACEQVTVGPRSPGTSAGSMKAAQPATLRRYGETNDKTDEII